jgi:uncharacterized protein with GYD domain
MESRNGRRDARASQSKPWSRRYLKKGCWRNIAIDQQGNFGLGLSLESGGTPYVAIRYADPLHPTRSRKNQGNPARLDAAKKAAEKAGGKIHAWYLTMGKYDAVIISECPNDEASAKFMLATGALGNVTTQTMKAFTEGEYRKIVASL